ILYIELVSLGSVKSTIVEPMNVYRFAVMKNAVRVIAVHNHPSGNLTPSPHDKDTTDRLIQVGRNQKNALIKFLMEKNTATEEIANILKIPPEEVEKATKKKT
ncbi:MAG TPA: JAB domain-containing protein, partial [Herbaspirillum sp.]|nr:JAB domain-containing protein [Herbaspirillum sp.]